MLTMLKPTIHITWHGAIECLRCGYHLDATSHLSKPISPKPGDLTVCANCHEVMVFTRSMNLRLPTEREVFEMADDDELRRLLQAMAQFSLVEWRRQKKGHD